jgi:hypothetical protein
VTPTGWVNHVAPKIFTGTSVDDLGGKFRIARDPGAIRSLADLIVTCAALHAEAWMITR